MRTDGGQTDMTKVIVVFPDFANAPKNKVVLANFLFAIQESLKYRTNLTLTWVIVSPGCCNNADSQMGGLRTGGIQPTRQMKHGRGVGTQSRCRIPVIPQDELSL